MMSHDAKPSSREVAREAEDVRAGLAETLEQLRNNLRPENVVEEVVSNARIGANTITDSLYGLARENPLPALLIGAGCALVMGFGTRKALQTSPVLDHEPIEAGSQRRVVFPKSSTPGSSRVRSSTRLGSGSVRTDHNRGDANRVGAAAIGIDTDPRSNEDMVQSPSKARQDTTDMASKSLPRSSRTMASKLSGLLHEQPLILAAIGVAVGAAIGAALPITETEDEWMGSASSSVRHAAEDVARSEIDDLRTVASRTMDSLKESASQHGMSAENVKDFVQDAGARAKYALHDAGPSSEPRSGQA